MQVNPIFPHQVFGQLKKHYPITTIGMCSISMQNLGPICSVVTEIFLQIFQSKMAAIAWENLAGIV